MGLSAFALSRTDKWLGASPAAAPRLPDPCPEAAGWPTAGTRLFLAAGEGVSTGPTPSAITPVENSGCGGTANIMVRYRSRSALVTCCGTPISWAPPSPVQPRRRSPPAPGPSLPPLRAPYTCRRVLPFYAPSHVACTRWQMWEPGATVSLGNWPSRPSSLAKIFRPKSPLAMPGRKNSETECVARGQLRSAARPGAF
jgi:hypothetical protein